MKTSNKIYLILQNIRSLHNVGAIFRSADAFQVNKIYLCGYTGAPPRKEISKTALGAEKYVPFEKHSQTARLIKKLKKQGVKIIALEQTKKSRLISCFRPTFPLALVVGNEVRGITPAILKLADAILQIPMKGKKESLNVAVACGIALYELNNKR